MTYPLEQLALIKQKKLEESEKALKARKEALQREEERLKTVETERDKVQEHRHAKLEQLREKLDAGTSTDKIQQIKSYLKVVDEQLKAKNLKVIEHEKLVATAKNHVEAARQDFLKKNQDVEKLRLHRVEWAQEQKKLLEHQENVETDELGSSMHARKSKKRR